MRRAFWTFIAFIVVSFLTTGLLLNSLAYIYMARSLEAHIAHQMDILVTITRGALAQHDYERIEEQVLLWGEKDPNVAVFRIAIEDDSPLVEFIRPARAADALHLTRSVGSPAGRIINFTIEYDTSEQRRNLLAMSCVSLAIASIAAFAFALSLWLLLQRMAIRPLQREAAERKRAEEEMVRLRNYLSNVVDSMPSVLVGVDPQGTVTQWNREAERVAGLKAERAVGQPLEKAFPRLATEMVRVREAMRTRQVRYEAKLARQEDSEIRYEDVTVYPLIANGIDGAVIRLDDVTQRVRFDEMLIQSEKMLSVGNLAAGMAHEINNPLAGMMHSASVLISRLSQDLPANEHAAEACGTTMEAIRAFMEQRGAVEMLGLIHESGARAARIVRNMLSFTRKTDSTPAQEDLCEILDRTVELAESDYDLKKKFDFRRIAIAREYEQDMPLVSCQANELQQVFLNIIKNGAEAMSQAGDSDQPTRQDADKPRLVLRVSRHEDIARIEIENNGPAMDDATRKRVFEPFFTTKEVGAGTGLGLSVSYFIITEQHHGTLAVESGQGQGTKFIISLPLDTQ